MYLQIPQFAPSGYIFMTYSMLPGAGTTGPWVGADLEAGMYYGGGSKTKVNNQSQPLPFDFVSLVLKGWTDGFELKGPQFVALFRTYQQENAEFPRDFCIFTTAIPGSVKLKKRQVAMRRGASKQ